MTTTHILMVCDMSGSMRRLAEDVRGGYNAYLDDLATKGGHYRITACLFDHEYIELCTDAAVADAPRLDEKNYVPRGSTALLDAVGRTIGAFERRVPELGEKDNVILVVQTDGHENSSKEYGYPAIKELLTERSKPGGKWAVLYIGAREDTWNQAAAMGVPVANYVHTSGSSGATQSTYRGLAEASALYNAGGSAEDAAAAIAAATDGQ